MPNRLASEKSPYLKQHANNPVDWFPWGDEAFAKARSENKIIFLSIGYSTCYWCHVMEKECFERDDVGAALNRDFVSVKVDREEHPDVDEIYMDAVMAMNGQGGWPMSVMLTPDLKPFWGATYIPRPNFLQLLERVQEAWKQSPDQILNGGARLLQAVGDAKPPPATDSISQTELFRRFAAQADSRFDSVNGGFNGAPKFPSSQAIRVLLRLYRDHKVPKLLEMAERSLEKMAGGGIYDQLGGGFHRYSVDDKWLVPHFEKMLYDNALLVPAYLEAFQLTGKKLYADVARETLNYLLRDMKAPGGAFFSAEDAGNVGKEGEFYVWKDEELKAVLGPEFSRFSAVFPVSAEGNFEHATNVLNLPDIAKWEESRSAEFGRLREKLLVARDRRPRPHRDAKILTGWNGLAISAFAHGYRVLGEERFLRAATTAAGWMREHLFRGGALLRRHVDGESRFNGTSADYAFLIQGLLELFEASFETTWLLWAAELQKKIDEDFWNQEAGGYLTAARNEPNLVARKTDRADGAVPSANSVSYGNLLRLAQYFVDPALDDKASALFLSHGDVPERFPLGLPSLLLGLHLRAGGGPRVLVLSGPDLKDPIAKLRAKFLPDLLVAAVQGEAPSAIPVLAGKTASTPTAYLCEDGTCHNPRPAAELIAELK
ncbi:MAG: thioredoxin domain-containing protein [Bdellovibrionota bacterium]